MITVYLQSSSTEIHGEDRIPSSYSTDVSPTTLSVFTSCSTVHVSDTPLSVFLLFMHTMFCWYVSLCTTSRKCPQRPEEGILWLWNYKQLCFTLWVLVMEPRSSGGAASALPTEPSLQPLPSPPRHISPLLHTQQLPNFSENPGSLPICPLHK